MSSLIGTELWDKSESIIAYNENNSIIMDKLQKVILEFCKSQSANTCIQKRLFEKYLTDNEPLNKSEFSFSTNTFFLVEKIFEIINVNETFCSALFTEMDDIVKIKSLEIKKNSRLIKSEMKSLTDNLVQENQKLDNDIKRYRAGFQAKDQAYNVFLKADANKALSRNQVDNYHEIYKNRNAQYEEAKKEYLVTLDNFNKFQAKHYSTFLGEWGSQVQNIETERYNIMRTTFTTLSELCKSMASKFNDIASQLESKIDTIECEKDCLILINKERTSDVPPQDVPFKDFDIPETNEACLNESHIIKTSNTGSDYMSLTNGTRKSSVTEILKNTRSLSHSVIKKENSIISNGISISGTKFLGKLFGGPKKPKESSVQNTPSEIENQDDLLEGKCSKNDECEPNDKLDQDISDIKITIDCLEQDCSESKESDSRNTLKRTQCTLKENDPEIKSMNENDFCNKNVSILTRFSRGSIRRLYDKRRSRSAANMTYMASTAADNFEDKLIKNENKTRAMVENKPVKLKKRQTFNARVQSIFGNNAEREDSNKHNSKSLDFEEVLGHIEIVSTPAEALASAARSSCVLAQDECYSDINNDDILNNDCSINPIIATTHVYYYVGSCVAIHEYESTDPSDIYLSFEVGQQFYIIQEDETTDNSGWLLVEKIDRSQSGYVPASYMDTRCFDEPVRIDSDHPIIMS